MALAGYPLKELPSLTSISYMTIVEMVTTTLMMLLTWLIERAVVMAPNAATMLTSLARKEPSTTS